jgi:hypothetical protein
MRAERECLLSAESPATSGSALSLRKSCGSLNVVIRGRCAEGHPVLEKGKEIYSKATVSLYPFTTIV